MNRVDHILWNITEECDEVSQRVSKSARFGLNEVQPGQNYDNAERIMHEFADLLGAMELLEDEGLIKYPSDFRALIDRKKSRFEKFLKISFQQGRLDNVKELKD